jgi:uncharacterized protein (TIGR02118 family)
MHKLSLTFLNPPDPAAFEDAWSREFVPRAEAMPGIRKVIVSRVIEQLSGPAEMVLVHEFLFDDLASAKAAMSSAAGQAAGQALMALPGVNVTLVLAEHLEEARQG